MEWSKMVTGWLRTDRRCLGYGSRWRRSLRGWKFRNPIARNHQFRKMGWASLEDYWYGSFISTVLECKWCCFQHSSQWKDSLYRWELRQRWRYLCDECRCMGRHKLALAGSWRKGRVRGQC